MSITARLKYHIKHPLRLSVTVGSIPQRLIEHAVYKEVFMEQTYHWLVQDLRPDTVAIDIGAFIGETAIYLAMQERISKVYSYELMPDNYTTAKANIDGSPFRDKIVLFNKAVGEKEGTVYAPKGGGDTITSISKSGIPVPAVGLDTALDNLRNVIIKCDAEGAEEQIFNPNVNLAQVYRIMLEYHAKRIRDRVLEVPQEERV